MATLVNVQNNGPAFLMIVFPPDPNSVLPPVQVLNGINYAVNYDFFNSWVSQNTDSALLTANPPLVSVLGPF